MSFEIAKRDLFAMSLLAAKQDIRYYLCGVCLEVGKTESRLIATNGHLLGVLNIGGKNDIKPGQYIIPLEVILMFKPTTHGSPTLFLEPVGIGANKAWSLYDPFAKVTKEFTMVEGNFPDYTKVFSFVRPAQKVDLKKVAALTHVDLNVDYLALFGKVNAMLTGKTRQPLQLYIGYDSHNKKAVVNFDDARFNGVVMGVAGGSNHEYEPRPWIARHAH